MQKLLLTIILLAFATTHTFAVKANSEPFNVTQPDGTTLTLTLHGDEDFSWYATTDGAIVAPSANGFRIASISADGDITPTDILAHNAPLRQAAETAAIRKQAAAMTLIDKAAAMRKAIRHKQSIINANPPYFPHTGTPTALVVLVNFSDVKFSVDNPVASFEQYLNGDKQEELGHGESRNHGSVAQYYSDMSNGQYKPRFKVVGPVTLQNTMAHYGANTASATDANQLEMCREVCAKASAITDFGAGELDSDNDGIADLVVIIHAGFGENNGASSDAIWSKAVSYDFGTYGTKSVRRMLVVSELNANERQLGKEGSFFATPRINGIGVFCHEFGHCLGLPDIYPTAASAQINNQALEYWSLMDGGSYVDQGYTPRTLTPWERETFGWHTPATITDNGTYTLTPLDAGGTSYKFCNPDNAEDYILLEDIQNTGWNSKLPAHGLIAYRMNFAETTITMTTHFNNVAGRPRMTMIPADGQLLSSYTTSTKPYKADMAGDLFPGPNGVSTLTTSQNLPNYRWYADNTAAVSADSFSPIAAGLTGIAEDTGLGTVTFTYWNDVSTGIAGTTADTAKPSPGRIFSTSGVSLGNDAGSLPHGVYIRDGKKFVK